MLILENNVVYEINNTDNSNTKIRKGLLYKLDSELNVLKFNTNLADYEIIDITKEYYINEELVEVDEFLSKKSKGVYLNIVDDIAKLYSTYKKQAVYTKADFLFEFTPQELEDFETSADINVKYFRKIFELMQENEIDLEDSRVYDGILALANAGVISVEKCNSILDGVDRIEKHK